MPRRILNAEELDIVRKAIERDHSVPVINETANPASLVVEYRKRGRITTALVLSMDTEEISVGVATFNPLDVQNRVPYSDALGERVAFAKAVNIRKCLPVV